MIEKLRLYLGHTKPEFHVQKATKKTKRQKHPKPIIVLSFFVKSTWCFELLFEFEDTFPLW